ncbi:MAG: cofactor-independent phosphoglycerate mutase [Omnitrophica bacterium RBG_13_46_9]|nr:MAG: cofactor-independent phosphoglycerate mutase [Omnitrophica bacterium RBG_13_46_9]
MKYIVLVGDGMSGRPLDELNGRTTLEVAERQYMDEITKRGRLGVATTIPKGMTAASDVANLSILGYDPKKYYSGRGPLEAVNIGVDLGKNDVAFRCNLITQADDKMIDYSAGHINTKEAKVLIEHVDSVLGNDRIKFYPGVSYRHLMVLKTVSPEEALKFSKIKCMPPHDIIGKSISKNLPQGEGEEALIALMDKSKGILGSNDINKVRIDLGENPANMIWLWGQGVMPTIPSFKDLYGISGSIISAVDLIKGIGKIIGLDVIDVPGATGYYDTNFKGKGEYALKSLENKDFVFVHVEAADEAGHNADIRAKITAIENFDKFVVGTIWEEFKGRGGFRIMLLPDHATPISCRTHTADPIPFVICGEGVEPDSACIFTETAAKASKFVIGQGHLLMEYLIRGRI